MILPAFGPALGEKEVVMDRNRRAWLVRAGLGAIEAAWESIEWSAHCQTHHRLAQAAGQAIPVV